MDYKKIIKSRSLRFKILEFLSFIPDKPMLKIQYRMKTGRKLNLKNPQRFTEKLQWYKINYRNPVMHQCVDKYKVRQFVEQRGLEDILVPLIKKYDSIDQINWDELLDSFVMKTTHGGGGLNIIVCKDKKELDRKDIVEKLQTGNKPFEKNSGGREWAYYGLCSEIVVEKLLVNRENPEAGINDYKIFCYDGKPEYIIVDVDRYIGHKRNFYDTKWNNLHISSDCPASNRGIEKPDNFERMMKIAEILSKGFPYVRVDLYNQEGRIYFGELTFYPWSGYVQFMPDEWDYKFGEPLRLIPFGGGYSPVIIFICKPCAAQPDWRCAA